MTEQTIHQPKGGMCSACGNYDRMRCSTLPFDQMPEIDRYQPDQNTTAIIVRCTEYDRNSV